MAFDKYHEAVRRGLIKQGWKVTSNSFVVKPSAKIRYVMDLAAEKIIFEAQNEKMEKIVVEVKTFGKESFTHEYSEVLGQYEQYKFALEYNSINRKLWLAIPENIYTQHFSDHFIMASCARHGVSIIVYDPILEIITQWI